LIACHFRRRADFHKRLVDELKAEGIQPFATLYHCDLPQALQDKYGGWQSAETAKAFGEYGGFMAKQLSDRVRHFFTINEFKQVGTISATGSTGTQPDGGYEFITFACRGICCQPPGNFLQIAASYLVAARYASDWAGGFSFARAALPLESASPSCPLSAGDPHADAAGGTGPVQKGDRCLEPVRP
jgi:hypothetical protein